MNKKGMFEYWEPLEIIGAFAILCLFLAALLFGIIIIFGLHIQTIESGEHTGIITAVEHTGLLFKTWRVYVKTDPQSSQEDAYCVIDENLIDGLKELSSSKQTVTVEFMDYFSAGITNCEFEEGGIITGWR